MPRNVANMTPKEREEFREYQRLKKQESRKKQRAQGLCTVRSPWCTGEAKTHDKDGNPIKDSPSCSECDRYSLEHEREQGWQPRPFKEIAKLAKRLRKEGLTVNQIVSHKDVQEWGGTRAQVSNVLRDAGLL